MWCSLHVFFFWNFVVMTWDMIKSTLWCVSVTHFSVELDFCSFQIVKIQLLIANIEVCWIKQVTLIFKNFGSKVHSVGRIAKSSIFVSFLLLWWGFRVLLELILSDYGFALLTKFVLGVWSKQIDNWDAFSIWYMDVIIHKVRNYLSFYLS